MRWVRGKVRGPCALPVHRLVRNKSTAPPRPRMTSTLRLTAEVVENLSAASGVAYIRLGAILLSLVAPNPAPHSVLLAKNLRLPSGALLKKTQLSET